MMSFAAVLVHRHRIGGRSASATNRARFFGVALAQFAKRAANDPLRVAPAQVDWRAILDSVALRRFSFIRELQ